MTTKLIQRHLLKGTYEYEIAGGKLNVRHKTLFGEKLHSVELAAIDSEPVIEKSHLEFVRRDNGETLVSLMLAKPDPQPFNDFVNTIRRYALADSRDVPAGRPHGTPAGQPIHDDEEPPEFFEPNDGGVRIRQEVDVEKVSGAIHMLQTHQQDAETEPLVRALEALQTAPRDARNLARLEQAFNDLGIRQGAVLTYAPYIGALLSDDPFAQE